MLHGPFHCCARTCRRRPVRSRLAVGDLASPPGSDGLDRPAGQCTPGSAGRSAYRTWPARGLGLVRHAGARAPAAPTRDRPLGRACVCRTNHVPAWHPSVRGDVLPSRPARGPAEASTNNGSSPHPFLPAAQARRHAARRAGGGRAAAGDASVNEPEKTGSTIRDRADTRPAPGAHPRLHRTAHHETSEVASLTVALGAGVGVEVFDPGLLDGEVGSREVLPAFTRCPRALGCCRGRSFRLDQPIIEPVVGRRAVGADRAAKHPNGRLVWRRLAGPRHLRWYPSTVDHGRHVYMHGSER